METPGTATAAVHDNNSSELPEKTWWVYIIQCNDGSLYTGVSTDPERRFREHLQHPRGAKYFNGRKPVSIEYTESGHTRSSASRREAEIKKLARAGKQALIASGKQVVAGDASGLSVFPHTP